MIVKVGKEIEEAEERSVGIAAFFDLDGTLLAGPSLERSFFRELRYRRAIGLKNYLWWIAQVLRLPPWGVTEMLQSNKMYLRGVAVAGGGPSLYRGLKNSPIADAIEQVAWHAERGDAMVIVSGALEFLARGAARELEMILSLRGIAAKIHVCATRLEEKDGRWTGRIIGEAMFGGAKARAARRFAAQTGCDLKQSFAYGNSIQDRWLLDAVGKPYAVNPSPGLLRLAQQNNWPILRWNGKELTHRAQTVSRKAEAISRPESLG